MFDFKFYYDTKRGEARVEEKTCNTVLYSVQKKCATQGGKFRSNLFTTILSLEFNLGAVFPRMG